MKLWKKSYWSFSVLQNRKPFKGAQFFHSLESKLSSSCSLSWQMFFVPKRHGTCHTPHTSQREWAARTVVMGEQERHGPHAGRGPGSLLLEVGVLLWGMCLSAARDKASFLILCFGGSCGRIILFKWLNLCLALCFFSSLAFQAGTGTVVIPCLGDSCLGENKHCEVEILSLFIKSLKR